MLFVSWQLCTPAKMASGPLAFYHGGWVPVEMGAGQRSGPFPGPAAGLPASALLTPHFIFLLRNNHPLLTAESREIYWNDTPWEASLIRGWAFCLNFLEQTLFRLIKLTVSWYFSCVVWLAASIRVELSSRPGSPSLSVAPDTPPFSVSWSSSWVAFPLPTSRAA